MAFAMVAFTASAHADQVTPVEQRLLSHGVKIEQSFTSVSGMRAIVANSGTEKRMFYVTPDGKNLIAGLVFDADGNNITPEDLKRAGVVNPVADKVLNEDQLDALWDRAGKLHWLQDGSTGKVIYVFFDPNCHFCHALWGNLRNDVKAGKVQVRWLPVAILADTSKGIAAALYGSSNTNYAMGMMANYDLQPIPVKDQANRDMSMNLLLLRDTGYTGVPALLFKRGNKVVSMMGAPTESELAELLNK